MNNGFERVKSNSSLYVYKKGTTRIIIPIYIDDITISSTSEKESDHIVAVVETSSTQHWKTNTQGSDDEVVAGTRAQCDHQLTLFAE